MTNSAKKHLSRRATRPERPTVHLTSFEASHLHGPGHRYSIVARPWRNWECGEGRVRSLSPEQEWIDELHEGFLSPRAFEWQCRKSFVALWPGSLVAEDVWNGNRKKERDVRDGDTLCCTCSVAEAEAGLCHRVWAAEALVAAGWRVVLDGKELSFERRTQAAA